jgi:hypothetical protein
MNAFTASDLEAADLLAWPGWTTTARRAPAACHGHSLAAPAQTMIAAAPPAAGGSVGLHPPVRATAAGRSRQRRAAPAGS